MLGLADKAAKAFWFAESVASAAAFWLMPAKACGLADMAANACGLPSAALYEPAFRIPALPADATSECASSDCSEWPARLSLAASLASFEKAELFWPIAAI